MHMVLGLISPGLTKSQCGLCQKGRSCYKCYNYFSPFFSEPTVIVTRPQSMKVVRGNDVRFDCGVKTDVTTPVTTTWMKDKKPVRLGWRLVPIHINTNRIHSFKVIQMIDGLVCEFQTDARGIQSGHH